MIPTENLIAGDHRISLDNHPNPFYPLPDTHEGTVHLPYLTARLKNLQYGIQIQTQTPTSPLKALVYIPYGQCVPAYMHTYTYRSEDPLGGQIVFSVSLSLRREKRG